MHVRLHSLVLQGLHGQVVDVEVDVSSGFPQFLLVGLADTVVQEARERVRSAIKNSGYKFPDGRVTVSLSPSHVRKEGAWFDLPIALGMLLASGQIHDPEGVSAQTVVCGELGLDGSVRATSNELALVMSIDQTKSVVLAHEALPSVSGVRVLCSGVKTLADAAHRLDAGTLEWVTPRHSTPLPRPFRPMPRLHGLAAVERAIQVALVGRHHILLYGPPGTGKSAISQLAQFWSPSVTPEQALEVGQVWSAAGYSATEVLQTRTPPFRAPHHTASAPAMVGGGRPLKAGEVSLSHHGILFLDELPEFRREVLEALREPLQEGFITINRSSGHATFPAQTQVLATLNPCPCGFWGDEQKVCTCSGASLEQYRRKLSGPLLDRFSLSIKVDRVEADQLLRAEQDVYSLGEIEQVRSQVEKARQLLHSVDSQDQLLPEVQALLVQAAQTFALSPRAIQSARQVAQSIAALGQRSQVIPADMAEALQYRWRGWTEK